MLIFQFDLNNYDEEGKLKVKYLSILHIKLSTKKF